MPRKTQSEKIKVNTVIKLYTLILLYEGPKHGYQIMKRLEEMTGSSVGPSQVYPFLRQLEEGGIIESTQIGPREKKLYDLTDEGKRFVKDILEKSLKLIQTSVKVLGPERVCVTDDK